MNYTAEEIVKKLKEEENYAISVRTLNFYAYDKKMFPNLSKGKSCFSDNELELLKRIKYLKENTSLTLDEIKECIADDKKYETQVEAAVTKALDGSEMLCLFEGKSFKRQMMPSCCSDTLSSTSFNTVSTTNTSFLNSVSTSSFCMENDATASQQSSNTQTIRVNEDITLTVSSNMPTERLREIIKFINNTENKAIQ